ncbi:trehalose operon repressor [Lactococcus hodotermopsidis]|uniref:Trehalose operon repressor n=1 Tax=Pseudolactococcus hodotermopsidis TaxID=2709157 RepID=A0A6A0BDX2_9LACT|nr:trehalose operon repressor [Lactococcus hodotermopsidis]GFH42893.1 trehalose operon repressor [Lactococcus hodotermopsidis]
MKKYEMILDYLENKVSDGIFKTGDILPSENELSDLFQTSRATVRRALVELENRGMIQKQRGRGSIVIKPDKLDFPISGLTSYKELVSALNFDSLTDVVSFDKVLIDKNLAELTRFEENTYAWRINRRRQIDGKFLVSDTDFIKFDLAPLLTAEIAADSIYQYLENELGITISFAQKEITIDFINQNDENLLDLDSNDRHVVSVKSHVYLNDASIFQYTESRHQVDKFRFTEFARRQKR